MSETVTRCVVTRCRRPPVEDFHILKKPFRACALHAPIIAVGGATAVSLLMRGAEAAAKRLGPDYVRAVIEQTKTIVSAAIGGGDAEVEERE